MGIDQLGADEQSYAEGLIHLKASQLVKHRAVRAADREDLRQELWLHLLKRLPTHSESKGSLFAFITTVIERRVRSILRYHNSRLPGCGDSLDEPIGRSDGELVDRYATLGSEPPHSPRAETREQYLTDLRFDLEQIIAKLPPDQQDVCRGLMTESLSAISRNKRVARGTLFGRVLKIREAFEEAGIHDYL